MAEQIELPFPESSRDTAVIVINERCTLQTCDGQRVVLVGGVPIAHYSVGDAMAEAHATVMLANGWATQEAVAHAFGISSRTVRRNLERFEEGGLSALGRPTGYPKGRPRVTAARERTVRRLKEQGLSNRKIAARVGVTERAIRKQLKRMGWRSPKATQKSFLDGQDGEQSEEQKTPQTPSSPVGETAGDLAAIEDHKAPAPVAGKARKDATSCAPQKSEQADSVDDPADRRLDRMLASLGMLEDAAPLFRDGARVPRGGVLLAVPALVHSGVLDLAAEIYGSLGPAFYGLRTTVLTLLLLALLRIKRPENLKEYSPDDLGRLLGLDRAPEVKTLRRKLARLAGTVGGATKLGHRLAERRVQTRGSVMGFLYIDGHVRAYHGKHDIPKTHVARMRISMPATTDYWVTDMVGDPLLVVSCEANAGMVAMLSPMLKEIRSLVGDERRVTIVFDRGGWSPKLFKKLIATGFDVLTYRKGRARRIARKKFVEHEATLEGRKVKYKLADGHVRLLRGKLKMRQVVRLSDDGKHQTQIITSREDLPTVEVAYRMFERWREENLFKYLREEYALDALVEYGVEPADPMREVPNPRWAAANARLKAAKDQVAEIMRGIGVELTMRKVRQDREMLDGLFGPDLARAVAQVIKLEERRDKIPRRIPVGRRQQSEVIKLGVERKHLSNVLKMVAYQAESELVRMLTPHYKRSDDEARTFIQSAMAGAANISIHGDELRVELCPLSSAHRTAALAAVCEQVNALDCRFPGSRLRLRYAVAP